VDALLRSLALNHQIGATVVVVDAKDDAARAFYEQHGFPRFVDHERRLFLPMVTIARPARA